MEMGTTTKNAVLKDKPLNGTRDKMLTININMNIYIDYMDSEQKFPHQYRDSH